MDIIMTITKMFKRHLFKIIIIYTFFNFQVFSDIQTTKSSGAPVGEAGC